MTGLMLCSAYELSFTMIGFLAALGTNVVEWYEIRSLTASQILKLYLTKWAPDIRLF